MRIFCLFNGVVAIISLIITVLLGVAADLASTGDELYYRDKIIIPLMIFGITAIIFVWTFNYG